LNNSLRKTPIKGKYQTDCNAGMPLLGGIRFFHGKYMFSIPEQELGHINNELTNAYTGKLIETEVRAYKAKGNLRHYLYLSVNGGGTKYGYVFVFKNSVLYQCVFVEGNS
jgi:hypothetical protein